MSAAEYVLGTLGAEERKAFARMAETDADARAALREWEQRFEGLNEVVEPLAPAPAVWSAIEKRLDDATTASNVVTLRRSVVRWRTATGLAGALAASLALFVIARPPGPPAPSSTQVATAAAPAPQSTTSAAGVGAKPGASGALAPTAGALPRSSPPARRVRKAADWRSASAVPNPRPLARRNRSLSPRFRQPARPRRSSRASRRARASSSSVVWRLRFRRARFSNCGRRRRAPRPRARQARRRRHSSRSAERSGARQSDDFGFARAGRSPGSAAPERVAGL